MSSNHHVKRSATVAVLLTLIPTAAATASAKPGHGSGTSISVVSCATYGPTGLRGVGPSDPQPEAPASTGARSENVARGTSSRGFDWGDAGIGAGGGIGLSILGLAGALTLTQRRGRRERGSSRSTALTS
jgi:hypothetical protein